HPPTGVDIDVIGTSLRAYRETFSGLATYRPQWLEMTIEDARKLRRELSSVLRGHRAPRQK
ncbi:MAG: hypothetical protein ACREBU_10155, partial [Nitrososphaera sp.]